MKKLLTAMAITLGLGFGTAQQAHPATTTTKTVVKKEVKTTAKPAVKLKADGTPDKRYKANKHLKKDGTVDKRFKK